MKKPRKMSDILSLVPERFSFISMRKERLGGFLFNPFLLNEVPLNELETKVLELCDGHHTTGDIIQATAREFSYSRNDAGTAVVNALNHFGQFFALNWRAGKKADKANLRKQVAIETERKPDDKLSFDYYSAPLSAIFEITNKCNLKCKHCLVDAGTALEDELSLEEIKGIIDQLKEMKVFTLNFGGGEPLLRTDFLEILDYASKLNMGIVISTNGYLVDDRLLDNLENIKTFAVQISVDGLEKCHDEFRGIKGSFKRAVEALKRFSERGYFTIMSTMMIKKNMDDIGSLIDLALSLGVSSFKLSTFMPSGRGKENVKNLLITGSELERLAGFVLNQKNKYSDRLHVDIQGTFPWLLENKPKKHPPEFKERHERIGCSAGQTNITISPIGEVFPCPFLRKSAAGSLRHSSFKAIWYDSEAFYMFRNIERGQIKGKCRNCEYAPHYCQAGCRAAAYLYSGDFYAEDPNCWYN